MRIPGLVAILSAVLVAAPAQADISARFLQGYGRGQQLVIEVNDRGDCRVGFGPHDMLVLGGVVYILESDYVVRLSDVIEVIRAQIEQAVADSDSEGNPPPATDEDFSSFFPSGPPPAPVQVIQGGAETVGGRRGTLWTIHHPDPAPRPIDDEIVVSPDADLAPLACALPATSFLSGSGQADPGDDPDGEIAARLAIQRQGIIIRDGRHLRLHSVDTRPIPPSRFVLPSAPLTREEYEARIARPSTMIRPASPLP